MEHTFLASYVCLLIGNLIMESKQHEVTVRKILRSQCFVDMVQILDKYYNFLNLTASVSISRSVAYVFVSIHLHFEFFLQSEAIYVTHMKETKRIIQFMKESDLNPGVSDLTCADELQRQTSPKSHPMHSTSNTYSGTSSENRWASNSSNTNTNTNTSSNSLFNTIYFSGR